MVLVVALTAFTALALASITMVFIVGLMALTVLTLVFIFTTLNDIMIKLYIIIDFLGSLNRATLAVRPWGTLDTTVALSASVISVLYCRCIIKGDYFHKAPHLCVKASPNNACHYCTSLYIKCETVRSLSCL